MIFNIISIIGFVISFVAGKLLAKYKYGEIIVRMLSGVILVYKLVWYLMLNIRGQLSIPVEISSISYFLVSALILFKIKKIYNIASFFGLSSGIGFFAFYVVAGFTVRSEIGMVDFIISNFLHGFLLIAGMVLIEKKNFNNSNKHVIWITILAMVVWALLFFDITQNGITFIYYIIKPSYLFIFENIWINIFIVLIFYATIITVFYLWLKLFYKINKRYCKAGIYN